MKNDGILTHSPLKLMRALPITSNVIIALYCYVLYGYGNFTREILTYFQNNTVVRTLCTKIVNAVVHGRALFLWGEVYCAPPPHFLPTIQWSALLLLSGALYSSLECNFLSSHSSPSIQGKSHEVYEMNLILLNCTFGQV